MAWFQEVLRHLAVNDRQMLGQLHVPDRIAGTPALDAREVALVRIASLVASDGPVETFRWNVGDALDAGASADMVVGVLIAVAPLVGFARVATTAPKIALALDYDLDSALEDFEP